MLALQTHGDNAVMQMTFVLDHHSLRSASDFLLRFFVPRGRFTCASGSASGSGDSSCNRPIQDKKDIETDREALTKIQNEVKRQKEE